MFREMIVECVLLLTLISTISCSSCSSPTSACTCFVDDDGKNVINCRYKGLHQIPSFTPTGQVYDRIIFTSTEPTGLCTYSDCNNITHLQAGAFANLRVKAIDLRNNPISSFDHGAFGGLEGILTELSIEGDGTEAPPYGSIAKLRHLQSLHLENFRQIDMTHANTDLIFPQLQTLTMSRIDGLSLIDPSVFAHIQLLKRLNLLQLPSLRLLPVGAILKLSQLQFLSVFETKVSTIYGDSFHKLSQLKSVDLDGNRDLISLERHAFRGIEDTLESLVLSRSGLDAGDLVIFKDLNWTTLTHLNLGNNNFGYISHGVFHTMNRLSFLDLQNTGLTLVNSSMFTGLTNLKTLDLGYNNIEHVAIAAFQNSPGLTFLILNEQITKAYIDIDYKSLYGINKVLENFLTKNNKIQPSAFWAIINTLQNLVQLDAGNLGISYIPENAFANNSKLSTIDLSGNKITYIGKGAFYGPRVSLSTIDLQNNKIQTLSKCVFNHFDRQPHFILNGNPLTCDCHILWFYDWVMRQPDPMVASITFGAACASPSELSGKLFFQFLRSEIRCAPGYVQPVCTHNMLSTTQTSSPSATTTAIIATTRTATPLYDLVVESITNTTITVGWRVSDKTNITGYLLEITSPVDGHTVVTHIHRNVLTYTFHALTNNKMYHLCLNLEINDVIDNINTECVSAKTRSSTDSTNLIPSELVVG